MAQSIRPGQSYWITISETVKVFLKLSINFTQPFRLCKRTFKTMDTVCAQGENSLQFSRSARLPQKMIDLSEDFTSNCLQGDSSKCHSAAAKWLSQRSSWSKCCFRHQPSHQCDDKRIEQWHELVITPLPPSQLNLSRKKIILQNLPLLDKLKKQKYT